MTLLSPSESHAFQTFLAHIDGDDTLDFTYVNHDWPYFTNNGVTITGSNNVANGNQQSRPHVQGQLQTKNVDGGSHDAESDHAHPPEVVKFAAEAHVAALPRVDGERKHLTLATKSLMSLDSNPVKWSESADRDIPMHPQQLPPPQRNMVAAGTNTTRVYGAAFKVPVQRAGSSSSVTSNDSAHRTNAVASSSKIRNAPPIAPVTNGKSPTKRPYDEDTRSITASSCVDYGAASTSSVSPPSSSHAGPAPKKHRSSTPQRRGSQQLSSSSHPTISSKPVPLLTPSQKKANHIQSEQKRRANIRRGYEALCETVPALREAIRMEDEAQAKALAAEMTGDGKLKRKRGSRKKGGGADRDKVDGRAGPRSENVVLQKTIDYIRDLISERTLLLSRLQRARELLPRNHPFVSSSSSGTNEVPLWEREWTGGLRNDLDDGGGGGEGDGDGGQDEDVEDEGGSESEG